MTTMIDVPETVLREALTTSLAVPRWDDDVAAHAPFASLDALLAAARAARPLDAAEIDEALAHHPRIGEQPTGTSTAAEFSRHEQSSADAGDADLALALAAGNAEYEHRFGRVFLIRAAGRTRAQILDELSRRLRLDDATERRIVGEQLVEIALLRLTATFGSDDDGSSA